VAGVSRPTKAQIAVLNREIQRLHEETARHATWWRMRLDEANAETRLRERDLAAVRQENVHLKREIALWNRDYRGGRLRRQKARRRK
jgi:hypothetical protein